MPVAVNPSKTLAEALINIGNSIEKEQYAELVMPTAQDFQDRLWEIVDMLNEQYSQLLSSPFDLYNWMNHNREDEVAYFLNEASSNVINHAEFPLTIQLWMGKKGFIIAVKQARKSFNAAEIAPGGGFAFFNECKNSIFWDDFLQAKIVYLEYLFR